MRPYLITSAVIFAAVAILHFLRLINDWALCTGSLVHSQVGLMGWDRVARMLVRLGTVSGIEKVISGARAPRRIGDSAPT